ncbi:hypothetical protein C8258_30165 [Nocardia sp. MDA0666]|uniref:hypothetical protein n=1 Tax=Nocardia sp. MDA0666 TaxID=2135448 RepID=UPI000D12A053|nr:hypothetical protein [Nocardia sp. MDA0666]PSR59183.1 hypothetical protein C8258_30165 [Nocardia sp. MDA0666]
MRHGDSSNTGIDKLLDSGKEGLNFFSTFIPRYKAWTGADPSGGNEATLTARYDQQRGMDVEPLRAIGTAIGQELNGAIGAAIQDQRVRLRELPSRWSGSTGADNAAQMVQRVADQIGKEHDNLDGIARALSAAAEQLENVVRTKADAVRTDFSTNTLAGKSADQIDKVISYARGDFGGAADVDEHRTKVRDILPEIGAADDPATYSKRWLDNVFVPALDGKIAAFTALTDATHTAVTGVYDQLAAALESLGSSPYTGPNGQPSAATSLEAGKPGDVSQALFGGMSVTPAAALTSTAPAGTSTAPMSDVSGQSTSKPVVTSVSAPAGDTPPGQGTLITPVSSSAPAKGNDGASKTTPTQQGQGSPTQQSPSTEPAKTPTSVTDMGKVGEWRPGDIANVLTAASQITGKIPDILTHIGDPLKAVGETAKDFGEVLKSVVGSDGITGLVKEGVDAAERIDKLIDHHSHPGEAAEQHSSSGQQSSGGHGGPQDHGQPKPPSAQSNAGSQAATTGEAGHPTGPAQDGAPPKNGTAGNEGRPIPDQASANRTVATSYSPAASTAANTSPLMSPSGLFGGMHGAAARSEGETEHRPKIQYGASIRQEEPDFIDAADGGTPNALSEDSRFGDLWTTRSDTTPSDAEASETGSSVPEVKSA